MSVTPSHDGRFTAMYMGDDRRTVTAQRVTRMRAALTERVGGLRVNGRLISQIGEADLLAACKRLKVDIDTVLSA